jgi:AraC-like DNA-binding protein
MLEYREIAPSPRFGDTIECFWSIRQTGAAALHRVLPDGCADILFTLDGARPTLDAVGPMTTWSDYRVAAGETLIGVRFRPGAWNRNLAVDDVRLTDAVVPLDALWGEGARNLRERLADARSLRAAGALFERVLTPEIGDPVSRALQWLEQCHGVVSLDDLARDAGLSARQFRRLCIRKTGLSPKFLARVLRFRHAMARLHNRPVSFAQFALECGYYDQAHCINEFRELSGRTPLWGRLQPARDFSPAAAEPG